MAIINGTSAADNLPGTQGSDVFFASSGNDLLDGRGGTDTISYAHWTGPIIVRLGLNGAAGAAEKSVVQLVLGGSSSPRHDSTDTLRSFENVIGTRYNDTIIGNELANTLSGLSGADTLNGGGGIDTADYSASTSGVTANISGGPSFGGHAEGDQLQAIENLIGSSYRDLLIGSAEDNKLEGMGDADTLNGGGGRDRLDGGAGNDTATYVFSPAGVIVNLTTNQASGANSDAVGDVLVSIENLTGSAFGDRLTGNAEANILQGMDRDDTLAGLGGADRLEGGDGIDTADYYASSGLIVVNLAANTASGGDAAGDTLVSIENVKGTRFADTLTGDYRDNQLEGMEQADVLAGLGGADRLFGGAGTDTADYSASTGGTDIWDIIYGVTVNLSTGLASGDHAEGDSLSSIENIFGSSQMDVLTGNGEANVLEGRGSDDVLEGLGGTDTLNGGDGAHDAASYVGSQLGVTVNLATNVNRSGDAAGDKLIGIEDVYGSKENDSLTGDSGDNGLYGMGKDDTLIGAGGNDDLMGGSGRDTLVGGIGRDHLDGGEDADTILYNSASESVYGFLDNGGFNFDRLSHFETGVDKLDLRNVDANIRMNGNQDFMLVQEFTGRAGELKITAPVDGGDSIDQSLLLGDLDGDRTPDFAIELVANVQVGQPLIVAGDIFGLV